MKQEVNFKTMANSNYNGTVYETVNKSDLTAQEIEGIQAKAIKEASEYHVLLYLTINSGKPPDPPTGSGGSGNG